MFRKAMVLALCCLCAAAQAAPSLAPPDELDSFLQGKGLVGQISNASQAVGDKASELVLNAMGYLGVPYKRGGNSFDTGFDCSGFVRALYEQTAGLLLPRKAEQQAAATQSIAKAELQPGDLVFFNTMRKAFSHVGIYVGDNKFIHSPRSGSAVRVEDMTLGYWTRRFDGARRVPNTSATPVLPAQAAIILEASPIAVSNPSTAAIDDSKR